MTSQEVGRNSALTYLRRKNKLTRFVVGSIALIALSSCVTDTSVDNRGAEGPPPPEIRLDLESATPGENEPSSDVCDIIPATRWTELGIVESQAQAPGPPEWQCTYYRDDLALGSRVDVTVQAESTVDSALAEYQGEIDQSLDVSISMIEVGSRIATEYKVSEPVTGSATCGILHEIADRKVVVVMARHLSSDEEINELCQRAASTFEVFVSEAS